MRQTITLGTAVAFAAALLVATPASADSPAGEYRGAMEDRGRPVAVALWLETGPMPGGPGGRIRFGEPWACFFKLEYSGGQPGRDLYSFRGAGAGRCEPYTLGLARVTQQAGDVFLEVFAANFDPRLKLELRLVRR